MFESKELTDGIFPFVSQLFKCLVWFFSFYKVDTYSGVELIYEIPVHLPKQHIWRNKIMEINAFCCNSMKWYMIPPEENLTDSVFVYNWYKIFQPSKNARMKAYRDGDSLTGRHGKSAVTGLFTVVFFQNVPSLSCQILYKTRLLNKIFQLNLCSYKIKVFVFICFYFNDLKIQNLYLFYK